MPLLLGELLPDDVERVLFLDADLLVLDDPTGLLEVDLGGRALAAAVDGAIALCSGPRGVRAWREQGIPAFAPYFNAGVMAISLRDWRERDGRRPRALRYLSTAGRRAAGSSTRRRSTRSPGTTGTSSTRAGTSSRATPVAATPAAAAPSSRGSSISRDA